MVIIRILPGTILHNPFLFVDLQILWIRISMGFSTSRELEFDREEKD